MSIVIVLSFIVCWTPYYLLGLWYWFFPDDLEGKVSQSLTHILFIFGLFNACLDPIIYGLFTIHFRKGLRRYYCKTNKASELENNTVITESISCNANSVTLKREVSPASQERLVWFSDSKTESSSPKSSSLTVNNDAETDPNHSSHESVMWGERRDSHPLHYCWYFMLFIYIYLLFDYLMCLVIVFLDCCLSIWHISLVAAYISVK